MLQPPVKKVRVVERFADDADGVVAAVCAPGWADGARVIKDTEKVSVLLGEAAGREVVVKTVGMKRFRLLGGTKLDRDIQGWRLIECFELPVPEYVALIRSEGVESLIMERVPGHSLLWEISHGDRTVRFDHILANRVGAYTRVLAQTANAFNDDHKASNILVRRKKDDYEIVLIDFDGVDQGGANSQAKMLAKLAIECIGCGVLPRRAVLMRVMRACFGKRPHKFWRKIEKVITAHGDPTPKDDPLEFDRRMMGID